MEEKLFLKPFGHKKAFSTLLAILTIVVVVVVVAIVGAVSVYIQFSTGNSQTQTMNFANFTAVNVGSAFKVSITQSSTFSVVITASQGMLNRIEVTQTGTTLKIDIQPGVFSGSFNAVAQITMPKLDKIVFSGATHGTASGFSSNDPFVADLSGASSLQMTNFQTGNITTELSGASSFTAVGTANNLVSVVYGASNLDFSNLRVHNAAVNLSGASSVQINISGRLDADLTGASSLQYSGAPTLGNISTSGASVISKK